PSPLALSVPAIGAAPSALAPAAAMSPAAALPVAAAAQVAPAPAPVRPAVVPTTIGSARTAAPRADPASDSKPGAAAVLALSARLTAETAPSDAGRQTFDGGSARDRSALTVGAAASDGPRLSRPAEAARAPAPKIPLKQRLGETAELGVMAAGFQLVTGLIFLALGAHAAFPMLAGALWVLAGGELVKQLGNLRSVIVGGWQASHDQKMRHDYGTGKLIDIRGRKYGEDRYDQTAPGPVSARERLVSGVTAFALGLPWVVPAGPKAVALYVAGAAAAFTVRRLWRLRHPEPEAVAKKPDFEYDR
ncbi:MAG: hypothetical protein ACHQ51_14975, partial [Elusimicrobiota bacterium]